MANVKDLEAKLESIPLVQYIAAGSCGVKYVSKGLEIVCCRPGKAEFTTLASDPLDNKVYQCFSGSSSKLTQAFACFAQGRLQEGFEDFRCG